MPTSFLADIPAKLHSRHSLAFSEYSPALYKKGQIASQLISTDIEFKTGVLEELAYTYDGLVLSFFALKKILTCYSL